MLICTVSYALFVVVVIVVLNSIYNHYNHASDEKKFVWGGEAPIVITPEYMMLATDLYGHDAGLPDGHYSCYAQYAPTQKKELLICSPSQETTKP